MMMTDGNEPCVDFLRFTIAAYRSKETDIDEVAPVTELPRITLTLALSSLLQTLACISRLAIDGSQLTLVLSSPS